MSKLTFIKSILSGKVNLSAFLKYLQKTNNLGLAANFSKLVSVSNHLSKDFGINFDTDFNELIQDIERLDALLSLEKKHRYEIGGGTKFNVAILYALVKAIKPNIFVETGVAAGVSSYFILKAMKENKKGKLVSIDLPNYTNRKGYINKEGVLDKVYTPKKKGVGWIVPDEFRKRWQLMLGDSMKILPKLKGNIDIFYHDSDHSYECMSYEYNWALHKKIQYITSDDITGNNAWKDFIGKNKLLSIENNGFGFTRIG